MVIDQNIPYRHIIMRLDPREYDRRAPSLPDGYAFKMYEAGDEHAWAAIQCSVGEFPTEEKALEWYRENYMKFYDERQLGAAQIFVRSPEGELVADTTARSGDFFRDRRRTQIDWVACKPAHQRKGLATALVRRAVEILMEIDPNHPILLPTQPASYAAVRMYWKLGFRISLGADVGGETTDADALDIIAPFCTDGFAEVLKNTAVE